MTSRRAPVALLCALAAGVPVVAAPSGSATATATVIEGVKVLEVLGTPVSLAAVLEALTPPPGPRTGSTLIRLVVDTPAPAPAVPLAQRLERAMDAAAGLLSAAAPALRPASDGTLQSGLAAAVSLIGQGGGEQPVAITVAFN